MRSNTELVTWCRSKIGCGYIFGSTGQTITEAFLQSKARQYPSQYTASYLERSRKWIGHVAYDCSGLIDAFLGIDDSADGYYRKSLRSARIGSWADIPAVAGLLMFKMDSAGHVYHIGVNDGSGHIIEARGVDYGVVESAMSINWTHYGYCHLIDYGGTSTVADLKFGSKGDEVKRLQEALNAIAQYGLVADGSFGAKTQAAVIDFQSKNGLTADGIVGPKTQTAITAALTPVPVAPTPVAPTPDYPAIIAAREAEIANLNNMIGQKDLAYGQLKTAYDELAQSNGIVTADMKKLANTIYKYIDK